MTNIRISRIGKIILNGPSRPYLMFADDFQNFCRDTAEYGKKYKGLF